MVEWDIKKWCEFYLSKGWFLIPVKDKKALCKWKDGEPCRINEYLDKDIDVAVATGTRSGVISVDVDGVRKDTKLDEKTKELMALLEGSGSRRFNTRSGNFQYLFRINPGTVVTNRQDIFNTKPNGYAIDVRGSGGLTVIPPSKGYAWADTNKIAELPDSISRIVSSPELTVKVARSNVAELPDDGERHPWFMSEIASALAKGWTIEKVTTHFITLNRGMDNPLDEADLSGLIERIHTMHLNNKERNKPFTPEPDEYHNGFDEVIKDIEGTVEAEPEFTTGFDKLDKATWGYSKGHLTVLSGVSEAGKSMLAQISFLKNVERGKKCLMFSAELMKKDVYKRLLIHSLKIPSSKFTKKNFTEEEKKKIYDKIKVWKTYGKNMMICSDSISPEDIENTTRRIKPDIVYVDYVQNLAFSGDGHAYFTKMIQNFHSIAKDLNIPVVLLSQLHDQYINVWNADKKQSERKKIDSDRGDVKMTKSIVQSADVLLTLNYKHDEASPIKGLKIGVSKNKVTGKTNSSYYSFDSEFLQYVPIEAAVYYQIGEVK